MFILFIFIIFFELKARLLLLTIKDEKWLLTSDDATDLQWVRKKKHHLNNNVNTILNKYFLFIISLNFCVFNKLFNSNYCNTKHKDLSYYYIYIYYFGLILSKNLSLNKFQYRNYKICTLCLPLTMKLLHFWLNVSSNIYLSDCNNNYNNTSIFSIIFIKIS